MARTKRLLSAPLLALLLILGGGGVLAWRLLGAGEESDAPPVHTVARGPLRVTVLESGSLEALESLTISSQVEGQVAIVFLIDEGTVLTEEDVAAGRVLVKLDSSELEEKIARQLIEVQSARAASVNATTSLEIQQKEDASKERQAVLKVEFARLDLRRSVGDVVAERVEALRRKVDLGVARPPTAASEPPSTGPAPGADGRAADAAQAAAELDRAIRGVLEAPGLKGETLQKLRQLRSDISLADEELKRAEVKWDWSQRLLAKDFVSRDEADADRLAVERRRIEKERAETAYSQYAIYDAPKELTRLLSDFVEAEGELQRVRDRARAAQERARAEVASKGEQEALQTKRYEKYVQQLASCVIRAPKPGLVLYASSSGERSYDDSRRIAEGSQVRERQAILTLPDTSQMGVRINVHESAIDKVRKGLAALVTVESGADRALPGVVEMVKDLPNPNDRWMNPDLKLYATTIRLSSAPPGLRPGLSAKAEILVEQLVDVLSVPVQCIAGPVGRPTVWVWDGEHATERRVQVGSTNDRFVVVLEGLAVGERVLLAPPRGGQGAPGARSDGQRPAGAEGGGRPPAARPGGEGGRPAPERVEPAEPAKPAAGAPPGAADASGSARPPAERRERPVR